MEHYLPEIFWHDRQGLLSVDFQKSSKKNGGHYKIVTTSMQKEVRIWEFVFEKVLKEGERDALAVNFIANITGHQAAVNVARFSPSGFCDLLASGDSAGVVFIWKFSGEASPSSVPPETNFDDFPLNKENWVRLHESDVSAICWSTDGQFLASSSNDESVVVQNVLTGHRLWTITNYRRFPNGIVWDPKGKYVVTMSTDRKMDILSAEKGAKLRCFHAALPHNWVISSLNCFIGLQVYKLFHDDQLISFTRGVDFSPDGELLIAPSAHLEVDDSNIYGTYVFRRRDFDKDCPTAFLRSRKPTFRAVCSPIVFKLRCDVAKNMLDLPYRIVWAVLTLDAIIFYDSQSPFPFSYVDGIHYNNLSDAAWSPDGKILLVSSLEGYCSFIRWCLMISGDTTSEVDASDLQNKQATKPKPKTPANLISNYFKKPPFSPLESKRIDLSNPAFEKDIS
ncbi:unnamed protein product [Enterobius vermicularis]|uniref:WD_REPEATS_REGION domain-containing protein n=1 Tax=Enterobius vermicularis TaxID=51028 RepID=A0A0N4V8Q1_ENTVE|nr:unnamed protein product [Enterobius vermicularis]